MPLSWIDYCRRAGLWIEASSDPDEARKRWALEAQQRHDIQLPMSHRSLLQATLDRKIARLRKQVMQDD